MERRSDGAVSRETESVPPEGLMTTSHMILSNSLRWVAE
jgi:hypothetical protein